MKGFCLFSGSKVTNNEKFRKQLQAKNKCLLGLIPVSYTHLRAHETPAHLV